MLKDAKWEAEVTARYVLVIFGYKPRPRPRHLWSESWRESVYALAGQYMDSEEIEGEMIDLADKTITLIRQNSSEWTCTTYCRINGMTDLCPGLPYIRPSTGMMFGVVFFVLFIIAIGAIGWLVGVGGNHLSRACPPGGSEQAPFYCSDGGPQ